MTTLPDAIRQVLTGMFAIPSYQIIRCLEDYQPLFFTKWSANSIVSELDAMVKSGELIHSFQNSESYYRLRSPHDPVPRNVKQGEML